MSQPPRYPSTRDSFLSQELTPESSPPSSSSSEQSSLPSSSLEPPLRLIVEPSTPFELRAHSQPRTLSPPPHPSQAYTQFDYRPIIAQQERDAAAAAADLQLERDAQQAAYDAEQAEFNAFLAANPSSPLPNLFGPGSPQFTPRAEAIDKRVLSLYRPIPVVSREQQQDVFYGNEQHANAAAAAAAATAAATAAFIRNTNAARIQAEAAAAAAAAAKRQGKGSKKKGGQRKTLKKSKSKSKSKSKRKSNKHKVQNKKTRRSRYN